VELNHNHRPIPLPQSAFTLSPLPITPKLDNVAALPVRDSSTDEIDPLSPPNPASSNIRCGSNHPGPSATSPPPPLAHLAHPEGIARQTRWEHIAGEISDREYAGQRTSGRTPYIGDPEQQDPSDLQPLPSAAPVFQPSAVPEPPLLVQGVLLRHGPSYGNGTGSMEADQGLVFTTRSEDSSLRINAPRTPSAFDASAQHISGKSSEQPYYTSDILGQRNPSHFAVILRLHCDSPHIPTNTENIRGTARIAEREVRIDALEMKICDLKASFEAEGHDKYAAITDYFNNRIRTIQKEISVRLNDVLGRPPGIGRCGYSQEGEASGY
jgi:hypothetical protein